MIVGSVVGLPVASIAAPASAAGPNTAGVSNGTLTVTYGDGAAQNFVQIDQTSADIVITDFSNIRLETGTGCSQTNRRAEVHCAIQGITAIAINTGDGNDDIIKSASIPGILNGGAGNDRITGGPAVGGVGVNHLIGGDGDDSLVGGPNRDILDGGAGADSFSSTFGHSTVTYLSRTKDVVAGIGSGTSGEVGENDYIAPSIWEIEGGSGDDTLSGNNITVDTTVEHSLRGGPGNDVLDIGVFDGKDILDGDDGDDLLKATNSKGRGEIHGGAGRDRITYNGIWRGVSISLNNIADDGEPGERDNVWSDIEDLEGTSGNDTLNGSDGDNALLGGFGNDVINGFGGNDTIDGSLDNDVIDGGSGNDAVTSDRFSDGNDIFRGGPGLDSVSYSARAFWPVDVSLDDVANDGTPPNDAPRELDNIGSDVETVFGTNQNDILVGNGSSNNLNGLGGNDTITAVDGIAGNDTIDGGDNVDACTADRGDTLTNCES